MTNVLLEKKGHIAVATINRPKALNALNSQVLEDLDELIGLVNTDEEIRVLILAAAAFFFFKGFFQHIDADNCQQRKGNPMVHRLNGIGKERAQEEADGRHQRLKTAEPEAAGHAGLQRSLLHCQALADGNRKGIHTDTHSQQKQFSNSHKKTPVPVHSGTEV